jgi:hypothetical protein
MFVETRQVATKDCINGYDAVLGRECACAYASPAGRSAQPRVLQVTMAALVPLFAVLVRGHT